MVQRLSPKEHSPYIPNSNPDRRLPVDSPPFSEIIQAKFPMIDKTDAVADLLTLRQSILRLAFSRPRKFGKSLVLDMAAEILAAGRLPEGVQPWYGYNPRPIGMFKGLKVYEKMLASDRLNTAHFVIKVSLDGGAGDGEGEGIVKQLSETAGESFGPAAGASVLETGTVRAALERLLRMVPRGVPVALLVDEYDSSVVKYAMANDLALATKSLDTLNNLLALTKNAPFSGQIQVCLVTGVSRVGFSGGFSWVNTFTDISDGELMSRVCGFTKDEIMSNFRPELLRLGANMAKNDDLSEEELIDTAMAGLTEYFNGYCFDGMTTCFAPHSVLAALDAGDLIGWKASRKDLLDTSLLNAPAEGLRKTLEKELDSAGGMAYEGLVRQLTVQGLHRLSVSGESGSTSDPALVPLLFQVGILAIDPRAQIGADGRVQLKIPNVVAREWFLWSVLDIKDVPKAAATEDSRKFFKNIVTEALKLAPTLAKLVVFLM